ncbi:cytochrome P450 [Streptomyces sp. NBC_01727]|uniref:cytochrome P450 n=1 Tax=Streptomyces sp. NBC_01727 TaxID=2975924 RepID=UPI002E12FD33|nr:cytochrome P450 [Streptomyces sp. NBC_01727]
MADPETEAPFVPTPASPDIRRRCPFSPPQNYEELRDRGRLGRYALPDGSEAWLVTSQTDAATVLTDRRFSSGINMAFLSEGEGAAPGWLFGLDAPEHGRLRRLLSPHFGARALAHMQPRIASFARERLDRIAAAGGPADLMVEYAWPLPGLIVHDLLGVPEEVREEVEQRLAVGDDATRSPEERLGAFRNTWQALLEFVEGRKPGAGDDLLDKLLGWGSGDDEARLTPPEAASLVLSLRLGGQAPVAHTFAMGVFRLLAQDGDLTSLPLDDEAQLDRVVDELLRYVPSNNLGVVRTVSEDLMLNGRAIPAGSRVYVNLPVVNRDPKRWPRADEMDLGRDGASHLAFGYGAHRCLGHHLARLELRILLRELALRFPHLGLACPPEEVPREVTTMTFGIAELPVVW